MGFNYIATIRRSTHHNKLALTKWLDLFKDAGLICTERSRSLGIMSGLSYLMWLDESFIPKKGTPTPQSDYSENAQLHADVKRIFSNIDPRADEYFQTNPDQRTQLMKLFLNGEVNELLKITRYSIFIC